MPAFTFEIFGRGETPAVADVLTLSDNLAIWCQVEALALQVEVGDGVAIRVKDAKRLNGNSHGRRDCIGLNREMFVHNVPPQRRGCATLFKCPPDGDLAFSPLYSL
jgi:hypothetical protein